MDDIAFFIMDKIIIPIVVFGILIVIIFGICSIPCCIKKDIEIERCFMQEPRTKECEFVLWKHELEMKKPTSRTYGVPVVVK